MQYEAEEMVEAVAAVSPAGNLREMLNVGGSAFDRNVASLMERIEYRRCNGGEDVEDIYRLRYKAYRAHQLVSDAPDMSMHDALDDTENCYRFGIFLDGKLVSTVRLHHLSEAQPFAPTMSVFEDVLRPRLERGETFIDPSRLAVDPDIGSAIRTLPYITLRLAVIANTFFDTTSCLCMIRDEHQAFYQRIFGSAAVAGPRPYASVNVLAILYESSVAKNMAKTVARFPFFMSTAMERRMLFAKPARGELAPLTVLPSTRYSFKVAA